ncbi:class I SAM-dependent methyltransferase [Methylobacterium gregans]|uniref:Class I SAM-dependent methyltransferase n=1 Tax=Methylobacterium gregans TaxID=374424 RepID=A0AA37HQN4_9HYPH|nr:class I SAM-dependent methyltransferase [Methylobacterium gregans]MDQ0521361.1 hypothetical protein [Methylobacterium gregans]GJD79880.1 hypothetical protein NBEOAGPD_3111 [Methylobacterium gregans]GLS54526.1 hypothetical protein GCM10007886_27090 [Methylobacterium gregans]
MAVDDDVHAEYANIPPSKTTGLTAYPEWVSKLPVAQSGLGGTATLFEDQRIRILLDLCPVDNYRVLELGPFEAGHTYMLHGAGAESIDAIEAHRSSYIKCVLAKEALDLTRAHFYLGDFVAWLQNTTKAYDLAVASGVLYHMADPVGLLDLLCKRANRIFLWTHYAPTTPYPDGHPLKQAYTGEIDEIEHKGEKLKLYQRTYLDVANTSTFCGGVRDRHAWMEKDGILALLRVNGFATQHVFMDQPEGHPNGPCLCIYAEKA